jgi:hypothetical protein
MRTFTIVAMAFLFVLVGVQRAVQADERKPQMVETKGETNAKAENAKETKELEALAEEAQGSQVKGTTEGARGKTKAARGSARGSAKQQKAKTE